MKTQSGVETHIFYKKNPSPKHKEQVKTIAKAVEGNIGCFVKVDGNEVDISPFMFDSPTNSPITIKKLIPKPTKCTPKKFTRGIQKVDTNVMTNAEAMKVIEDNHIKKVEKREKQVQVKKMVKNVEKKMRNKTRKHPIKSNPKL